MSMNSNKLEKMKSSKRKFHTDIKPKVSFNVVCMQTERKIFMSFLNASSKAERKNSD